MTKFDKHLSCQICNKEFKSFGGLHGHLKKTEGVEQKDYYEKYYPKTDIYSGEQIPFHSLDDYSVREFVDKKSEFSYLKDPMFGSKGKKELLARQMKDALSRGLKRFPTYCEWRSSKNLRYDTLFNLDLFNSLIVSCKDLGGTFNLNYNDGPFEINREEREILVDTREQIPLLDCPKTTVNVGDYTLSKENYNGVHVDRKSKNDFISTFTAGLDRFQKECQKAKDMDIYLVVLVEESFSECFNYKPSGRTMQKVTGENAFYGVRKIMRGFDNVQFLFVLDRGEAVNYLKLILNNKDLIKHNDLQFIYELGAFK